MNAESIFYELQDLGIREGWFAGVNSLRVVDEQTALDGYVKEAIRQKMHELDEDTFNAYLKDGYPKKVLKDLHVHALALYEQNRVLREKTNAKNKALNKEMAEENKEAEEKNKPFPHKAEDFKPSIYVTAKVKTLPAEHCATLIAYTHIFRTVFSQQSLRDPLARGKLCIYNPSGANRGVYEPVSTMHVKRWCDEVFGQRSARWTADFLEALSSICEGEEYRVVENFNRDLIPFKDCIWDYKRKARIEFHPDFVFLSKKRRPAPCSESYEDSSIVTELFSNDVAFPPVEPVHTYPDGTTIKLSEMIGQYCAFDGGFEFFVSLYGACLRNNNVWRKAVTLYNPKGRNGKSTMLKLFTHAVGIENTFNTSIEDLAGTNGRSRFALPGIVGKQLAVVSDSNAGEYIPNTDQLKRIIAHEELQIEGKNKDLFVYTPHVLIVMASNDLPKTRDKGTAWLDRQIFVPIEGNFTQIDPAVQDFIISNEVLRYLDYLALIDLPEYYELPEPEACERVKAEFNRENNAIFEFLEHVEFFTNISGGIVPFNYMYEKYKGWIGHHRPSMKNRIEGSAQFRKEVCKILVTQKQLFEDPITDKGSYKQYTLTESLQVPTNKLDPPITLYCGTRIRGLKKVA